MSSACRHTRAFSLIEAVIVLGIVGLVLGGIWAGASAVSRKSEINRAIDGMFYIANELTRKFNGDPKGTTGTYITRLSAQWKIIPADWPLDPGGGEYVTSPLGGRFSLYSTGSRFELRYYDLTRAQCFSLVSAFFNARRTEQSLFTNQYVWDQYAAVQVSPTRSKDEYCLGNDNSLIFYVTLKRYY